MLTCCLSPQDFPLLWLDNVVGDQSNVLGFSMLNSSHVFYLDFIRSLNLSWREGCRINPYPGPAVSCTRGAGLQPLQRFPVGHMTRHRPMAVPLQLCTNEQQQEGL